ncbi:MAG: tetratricopeptide repeat protein [Planctomycetota bacterium]
MMNPKTRSWQAHGVRVLLAVAGAGAALTLTACSSGHGKYTQEHLNAAHERMSVLRSGTEWDLARQAFLAGDLKKAEKKVDLSIAHNERVAKSHVLRGRIMLEQGRMDEAITSLQTAIELQPENVDAPYFLGVVFERLLDRETALSHFTRAAELDPNDPQYGIAAAEMLIDLGDPAGARAFLESRENEYKHAPGVRQTLGHIAMIEGDTELAMSYFNEAQLLAPEDDGILEDLVWAQVETERYGEAEYNLSRLMEIEDHEERRDLQHLHVRCLMELDQPVEARALLDELVRGDAGAGDVQAWRALGFIAVELNDQGRLREASKRVVSLAPRHPDGHFLRALWLYRMGRADAAYPAITEATRLDASNADYQLLTGLVLQKLGRQDDAARSFAQAIRIDPGNMLAREMADAPVSASVTSVPVDNE